MEREFKQVIRQKITDALNATVPAHTRRDIHLPTIKGKALAVIGMRRSGKTTFLWQCLANRLAAGTPRDALLYFNFEDERLADAKRLAVDAKGIVSGLVLDPVIVANREQLLAHPVARAAGDLV